MYADGESGLYYVWNRYLDPRTGRWIGADRRSVAEHVQRWRANLGVSGQPPLEINAYAYVGNNPLKWIDPEGLAGGGARPAVRGGGAGTRPPARNPPMSVNERSKGLLGLLELLDRPEAPPGCVISFEYECPPPDPNRGGMCRADQPPTHEAWPEGHSSPLTCLEPRMVVRCR